MDVDLEEPTIKILVLAEKDLSKRNFIDSFRRCLKYKSFNEYYRTEYKNQTGVSDTFNARYKKVCLIDTPEVDPNASLSANLAVIRSIKLLFHTSGHLNGILCLIHNKSKHYKNYLELIFTHLFTAELLPEIMKKLLFVFVKGNESTEAVELSFGNFLKKYEVDISQTSWINWPVDIVDVVYNVRYLMDVIQMEPKWTELIIFFEQVYEYIVERNIGKVQLECKFSNKSDLKIVKNFLDILTEIAFTIEDNMVVAAKYKKPNIYNNTGDTIQILESKNYCISICRSVKCASKNKGICCECKLVLKPGDIKKCTLFMPPSNMCTNCGCSITKHDAAPYKVTSQSYNSSNYQHLLSSIEKNRRFVINTICALTIFKEEYDLLKIFKNRLQEKFNTDSRENSPYKNLIFQFEETMNQIGKTKSDVSINDVSIMDLLKCIETAVEKSLISVDYRNAFLSPDFKLVACNRDVGDEDDEKNFNLSKKDKHLEENFNNLNV